MPKMINYFSRHSRNITTIPTSQKIKPAVEIVL